MTMLWMAHPYVATPSATRPPGRLSRSTGCRVELGTLTSTVKRCSSHSQWW